MYHPQAQLRSEITALIQEALGPDVPVLDSALSDIEKNPVTVIVTSAGGYAERAPGAGQRGGTPYVRTFRFEIIVVSVFDGDGPDAQLQADDTARQIEIALNQPFDPGLDLVTTENEMTLGDRSIVQISMLYETQLTDTMERN